MELKESAVSIKEIKHKILWDFDLKNEFKNKQRGFAFVIDVYDKTPQLVLYKVGGFMSQTKPIEKQPPREMLVRAVEEQGGSLDDSDLFNASEEVKSWVKENLL